VLLLAPRVWLWRSVAVVLDDDTGFTYADSLRYTGFHYVVGVCVFLLFKTPAQVEDDAVSQLHSLMLRLPFITHAGLALQQHGYPLPHPGWLSRSQLNAQQQPRAVFAAAELAAVSAAGHT